MKFETPTFRDAEADAVDAQVPVTTHWCWVRIDRGPMEKPLVCVRVHELPILRAIHGDANVARSDSAPESEDFHEIDATAEYARLESFYGLHTKDESFVEHVFGRFDEGRFVRELQAIGPPPKPRGRPPKNIANDVGALETATV